LIFEPTSGTQVPTTDAPPFEWDKWHSDVGSAINALPGSVAADTTGGTAQWKCLVHYSFKAPDTDNKNVGNTVQRLAISQRALYLDEDRANVFTSCVHAVMAAAHLHDPHPLLQQLFAEFLCPHRQHENDASRSARDVLKTLIPELELSKLSQSKAEPPLFTFSTSGKRNPHTQENKSLSPLTYLVIHAAGIVEYAGFKLTGNENMEGSSESELRQIDADSKASHKTKLQIFDVLLHEVKLRNPITEVTRRGVLLALGQVPSVRR
jgi:hypothetical protein